MSRRRRGGRERQARKPEAPRVTLGDAVLASGQRLRQGECMNWCTFLVSFRAQWQAQRPAGAR